MRSEKEIEQEENRSHEVLARLKKEKRKVLVNSGKAFYCKKCNRFVEKCTISSNQERELLCCRCFREKERINRKKILWKKMRGAKVIDIDPMGLDTLKGLTLYIDGRLFELEADGDCDGHWIDLVETKKQLVDDDVVRPGDRLRLEKSLEKYFR